MPQKKPPPQRKRRPQRSAPHTPTIAAPETSPVASPRYLTVKEVAKLLRVTPKAIYTRIEREQLPGVLRHSRRILIDSRVLNTWLDGLVDASRKAPRQKQDEQPSEKKTEAESLNP